MDYKYINQLLERYWAAETTLEEEKILSAFFSQKDIPSELKPYQQLFAFAAETKAEDRLGDDFDERMMALVDEQKPVKARMVTMRHKLAPLVRAAAMVAVVLTLGNASQAAFDRSGEAGATEMAGAAGVQENGASVAKTDSMSIDSINRTSQTVVPQATLE